MKVPLIISIGGGKGGVGKSLITANIGALLSQRGYSVLFVDGDLGGANLHHYLGVRRPERGLHDFLKGTYSSLEEVALPTCLPGARLISGASDIIQLANPAFAHKQKLITHLKRAAADVVLVDLGAGSDTQVCDFFAAFTNSIVVCDGLPTSIENAYGFLKNGLIRGFMRQFPGMRDFQKRIQQLADPSAAQGCSTICEVLTHLESEFPQQTTQLRQWLQAKKTFLVMNMIRDKADIEVGNRFSTIVKQYLNLSLLYIGYVQFALEVRDSVREMVPAVTRPTCESRLHSCFCAITDNLCTLTLQGAV
jgi:flagellar biosynthesis protein FlhG